MKSLVLSFATLSLLSPFAMAEAQTKVSDFYQDWNLDASQSSSSQCAKRLSGYAGITGYFGTDVPGTKGQPHAALDDNQSIRFVPDDLEAPEVFTVGTNPSQIGNGNTTMSVGDHELLITDQSRKAFFWKSTSRTDSYQLLPNGGLRVEKNSKSENSSCVYGNAQADAVGKVEVGAVLLNHGVQVAECSFVPATPTAIETSLSIVYDKKCTFGKFTIKQIIDDAKRVLSTELVANDQAPDEMQIVTSSDLLNTQTENYLSRDTEIAVQNSAVDGIDSKRNYYYFSPYRKDQDTQSSNPLAGTQAKIQIVYGPAQN